MKRNNKLIKYITDKVIDVRDEQITGPVEIVSNYPACEPVEIKSRVLCREAMTRADIMKGLFARIEPLAPGDMI